MRASLRLTRPVAPGQIGPSLDAATLSFLAGAVAVVAWAAVHAPASLEVIPILFAGAAACVVGLARRRAASITWLAAIGGMFSAAAVPVAFASGADPAAVGLAGWLTWAVPAGAASLLDLWIAAGYATRRGHRFEPASVIVSGALLAWFAIAVVVTIVAVIAGERENPSFSWIDVASVPIAWFRPFVVALVTLGALADIRDAFERGRTRLPATATASELAAATIRELVPGQAAAEETRAAEERVRLAGDLHAAVVPSLRRAIEEAEGGADPRAVLRHLRAADLELERLMAERWPIVLETFGLVPALEELAERLEDGGSPPITLEVGPIEGRPPTPVERAAWRVAQVTLDNAIRHAAAGSIAVVVSATPRRVHLAVTDDGRGYDLAGRRPGGRGIADAETRAAGVGATFVVAPRPGGGTTAAFDWPAGAS